MSGNAVVLFSGGQDSTTCLAWAIDKWGRENVHPVSFYYGQKHEVELAQARKICAMLNCDSPVVLNLGILSDLGAAALTNEEIRVEATAEEHSGADTNWWAVEHGLPSTFVPGRNLLFFTAAAAFAAKHNITDLVTGICEADAAGYPDCREVFKNYAQEAISAALDEPFTIHAPLLRLNKAKTFDMAEKLDALEVVVNHSHTCYNGDRSIMHDWGRGCGECPACKERAKGWNEFQEMKVGA